MVIQEADGLPGGAEREADPHRREEGGQAGPPVPLPRGASEAELDALRVAVRKRGRSLEPEERPAAVPRSLPPPAAMIVFEPELDEWIDQGRALLDHDLRAAHALFERAFNRNLNLPRVQSHYGLTLVLVEGDRQRGIRFCEEAVRRGPVTGELLVNLARALVQTRNKEQAIRALVKASELAPDDPRVRVEFEALGLRRRPPIAFLARSNPLNKWLGKLTWLLFGRGRS